MRAVIFGYPPLLKTSLRLLPKDKMVLHFHNTGTIRVEPRCQSHGLEFSVDQLWHSSWKSELVATHGWVCCSLENILSSRWPKTGVRHEKKHKKNKKRSVLLDSSSQETCLGLQTAIYTVSQLVISLKSPHISNTSSLPCCHNSCTSECTTKLWWGSSLGGAGWEVFVEVLHVCHKSQWSYQSCSR